MIVCRSCGTGREYSRQSARSNTWRRMGQRIRARSALLSVQFPRRSRNPPLERDSPGLPCAAEGRPSPDRRRTPAQFIGLTRARTNGMKHGIAVGDQIALVGGVPRFSSVREVPPPIAQIVGRVRHGRRPPHASGGRILMAQPKQGWLNHAVRFIVHKEAVPRRQRVCGEGIVPGQSN